ncbi:hypothetical protein GCM10010365_20270 [Streptomyces poonensis]|uniref:Uncharacterized protein n=1 Tax=Streptomyces poonensis TaxID=68255 RepID=A0A918UFK5_9ACTN|nr:hypothetical protein GCM10010365_20270 [Streptomyces poonensis]GLJ90359.1 hypothetical protein GCM10017589_29620 [Streptomyces poonensis]
MRPAAATALRCTRLTAQRRAAGGPTIELARENDVLQQYSEALGRPGISLAMLLTELGRRWLPARGLDFDTIKTSADVPLTDQGTDAGGGSPLSTGGVSARSSPMD